MLSKSDFSLAEAERLLAPLGVSAAYLSPTPTALEKSIIDAIDPIRALLKRSGIHDFDLQRQGKGNRVELPIRVFAHGSSLERTVSLYRPSTKRGDPRIWISRLGRVVSPHNLLALAVVGRELCALCMSDPQTRRQLSDPGSELYRFLSTSAAEHEAEARQVVAALVEIARRGWLPATHRGDTAVGMTLERSLGIRPNSSRAPDFLGFELKAKVLKEGESEPSDSLTRQTLFACVPDWDISQFKSSRDFIRAVGYNDPTGRARRLLRCTVRSLRPNPQGLVFSVDDTHGHLVEYRRVTGVLREALRWRGDRLEQRLAAKHARTAWVYARETSLGGHRHFRFAKAMISSGPRAGAFLNLIHAGVVTMDHLGKEDSAGRVSERGPLFKIMARDLGLVFPRRQFVNLTDSAA
jgi:hypothetical protein